MAKKDKRKRVEMAWLTGPPPPPPVREPVPPPVPAAAAVPDPPAPPASPPPALHPAVVPARASAPPPDAPPPADDWAAALIGDGRRSARLLGARLCFGKPVQADGRTIVPVASVRRFGLRLGRRRRPPSARSADPGAPAASTPVAREGGAGGYMHSQPRGFIDIGPEGARYQPIGGPGLGTRGLGAGIALLGGLLAGRALGGRRRGVAGGGLRRPRAVAPPSLPRWSGR